MVRLAASGILFLGICAACQPAQASTDRQQSSLETRHQDSGPGILPAETCDEPPALDDATLLAQRILEAPEGILQVDRRERAALADELDSVLRLVRDALPDAFDIRVHPRHAPGQLLIHFEPDLWDLIEGAIAVPERGSVLRASYPAFDALNAQLKITGLTPYPAFQSALLCFDDRLDVEEAAAEYMGQKGIAWAEPNSVLDDGPDIRAFLWPDYWLVIVEDAHGDCPSGCIHREFHYFLVADGQANRLTPEEADRIRDHLDSYRPATR